MAVKTQTHFARRSRSTHRVEHGVVRSCCHQKQRLDDGHGLLCRMSSLFASPHKADIQGSFKHGRWARNEAHLTRFPTRHLTSIQKVLGIGYRSIGRKMQAGVLSRSPTANYGRTILVVPSEPRHQSDAVGERCDLVCEYLGKSPNKDMLGNSARGPNDCRQPVVVVFANAADALVVPRIENGRFDVGCVRESIEHICCWKYLDGRLYLGVVGLCGVGQLRKRRLLHGRLPRGRSIRWQPQMGAQLVDPFFSGGAMMSAFG